MLDLLRGFALLLIVVIHYVEHFDFFMPPVSDVFFTSENNKKVMDWVFILISGKAYSIFALLFGYSFFIQFNKKEQNGEDFRVRYLWRLAILFSIGFLHSLIYKGDILHIYAFFGVVLLAVYRLKESLLIIIAVLLALQLPSIYQLFLASTQTDYTYHQSFGSGLWQLADKTYAQGSIWDVISFNLWQGRTTVWGWTYYNGRYLQLIALFILGMVFARNQFLENIDEYKNQIIKVLIGSAVLALLLKGAIEAFSMADLSKFQTKHLNIILNSYYNLAFTSVIISGLILIFRHFKNSATARLLAAYGRMSMTNYLTQSLIGVFIFYGFGLGMYRYLGSSWSLLLGLLVFVIQAYFSLKWQKHYRYGPFEWLWRSLTYFDFSTKMKKGSY